MTFTGQVLNRTATGAENGPVRARSGWELTSRILLVSLFPPSGIDKVIHWDLALKQANSSVLPGGRALLVIGMAIEFICPVLIVAGRFDSPAAIVLALFSALTALLYHDFWTLPGLFSASGGPGLDDMWEFLKNFTIVGGLMFVIRDGRWSYSGRYT